MNFPAALNKLWPKASSQKKAAIARIYQDVFVEWGIDDEPLVIAHLMAQISHENGAGTVIRENMNYRAARIMEIFGVGKHSANVTAAEAQKLAGNPEALAERVYGLGNPKKAKELGNTRPGDGYRFRGGGDLQLTGGANYREEGERTGFDLYNNPRLLEDPETSFRVAVAEFVKLNCVSAAKQDNVTLVTKRVNGGRNGLAERSVWLRKWKEALDGVDAPVWAPRAAELDEAPKLLSTRTGQIGTVATVTGITSTVAQVSQYAGTVSDTVTSVQDGAAQVVDTVRVIKPFLGLMPQTWMAVGIGASVAVIVCAVAILIYRQLKIRNEAA